MKVYLTLLCFFIFTGLARADDIRPGYLQLQTDDNLNFSVIWKVPNLSKTNQLLSPIFPDNCISKSSKRSISSNNASTQHWSIFCDKGIIDKAISIDGLNKSNLDILVRVQQANGITQMQRLSATNTQFKLLPEVSNWQVVEVYTGLGIEHILLGFDHLLFVFALLLIIKSKGRLLGAITAFTFAHSITLTLASLNLVKLPLPPVEAVIALSIVFLAVEIIHAQKGRPGIAENSPWLVAFIFGLLHGFGFAGALAEIGLPENALPLALLFFNVGVELGQLAFIAFVLIITTLFKTRITINTQHRIMLSCAYVIGSLASFWVFERTVSFFI